MIRNNLVLIAIATFHGHSYFPQRISIITPCIRPEEYPKVAALLVCKFPN